MCFPLIALGLDYSPHLTFAALRAILAGVALLVLAVFLRRPFPTGARTWTHLVFIGLGATTFGFLGMFHAAEFVSPGIATVIANTQPLMAAMLAHFLLKERLGMHGKIGLFLGFLGVILIALPQFSVGPAGGYLLGVAYIVLAAAGITLSNLVIKRVAGTIDPLMAMGWQLVLGSVPLWLAAWGTEDPTAIVWSAEFVVSLLSLSLLGSALAYWLWCLVLQRVELSRANAFAFLVPVFGLAMGVWLYGERIGGLAIGGIVLILIGVTLVNRRLVTTGTG